MFYFILFYLFFGYYHILINKELDIIYSIILLYFTVKIIINYRKCTLSYLECKIRNVDKEKGYINNFFDDLFDIRYESKEKKYTLLILSLILIYYCFFIKNSEIKVLMKNIFDKFKK